MEKELKILCFTCSVDRKRCSILQIPGLKATDLESCPDYKRQPGAKIEKAEEKAIQTKMF